jgi:DNA (cytosine-5)-methyltransferase 1
VYYNEFDPFTAQWLRNLIQAGHLPEGEVDERSIAEVEPEDLQGYSQCHFFAGIGGWALALRLAGVPESRPLWTGSCPCQPFSLAGEQHGIADPRHLWPVWERLIAILRPPTVLGEQVEAAVGHGWLDIVFGDLEAQGYACGAAILGAHSVGAPHIRQRLYWVGDAEGGRRGGIGIDPEAAAGMGEPRQAGAAGFWDACEWLLFSDGMSRPAEPGSFPLAYGVPGRLGRLHAFGNAVVP